VVPQRGGAIRSRAGGGDRKRQKQGHGQEADGASHDAIAEQESRAGAESAEPSDGPKYAALRRALLAVSNPGESFRSADVANWLEQVHREGPTPLWKERSARVKYIRRQLESLSQKGFVVQKGKAKQGSDKQFTLTDRGRAVVEQGLRAAGGEACGGAAAGVAAGAAAGGEAAAGGNAGGARLERLEQRMTAIETNVHSKVDRMMAMLEQLTAQ
jgi:DNA-binding MarR family transcriptional regulator